MTFLVTVCNSLGGYTLRTSLPTPKISQPVILPDQEKHGEKNIFTMMGEIKTAARGTNLPDRKATPQNSSIIFTVGKR